MRKSIIYGLAVACVLAGCGGEDLEDVGDEWGREEPEDTPVTAMHVPVEQNDSFEIPFDFHGRMTERLDARPQVRDPNTGRGLIRVRVPRPRYTATRLSALPKREFNSVDLDSLIGNNFAGLGRDFGASFISLHNQAAPSGDVDSRFYVQAVNDNVAVFDKVRRTVIAGPVQAQRLWADTPCAPLALTDGTVRYDALNERWIITYRATERGSARTGSEPRLALGAIESASTLDPEPEVHASWANRDIQYQCVAVSTTPDPLGVYVRYIATFENFHATPKLSVWRDSYYLTTTMSAVDDRGNITPRRARICAMEQGRMLVGGRARMLCFDLEANARHYRDLLAADLDVEKAPGAPPPPGTPPPSTPLYVFSLRQTEPRVPMTSSTYPFFNRIGVWKVRVNWNDPNPFQTSTLTGPHELMVESFQRGFEVRSAARLDPLDYKLVGRAPYRNFGTHQAVVLTHSVHRPQDIQRGSALRWYEIRLPADPNEWPARRPFQHGTYAPDTRYRWLGSIAFDKVGNIAMAYTLAEDNLNLSLAYTGRTTSCNTTGSTGTRGTMARVDKRLKQGEVPQSFPNWATSSTLNVDPDGCTFWYTAQYTKRGASGPNIWSTYISSFRLPGCVNNTSQSVPCSSLP